MKKTIIALTFVSFLSLDLSVAQAANTAPVDHAVVQQNEMNKDLNTTNAAMNNAKVAPVAKNGSLIARKKKKKKKTPQVNGSVNESTSN